MGEVGVVNCLATDATYSRETQPTQLKIHPLKGRVSDSCGRPSVSFLIKYKIIIIIIIIII